MFQFSSCPYLYFDCERQIYISLCSDFTAPYSSMVFCVTCTMVSLTLFLRRMLGWTNDHQLDHSCDLMTLGNQMRLLISWHEHVQSCYEVHVYVTQWFTSWLKCTQMTLSISMLKNILLWRAAHCILECIHLTLAIHMLNNILPLHNQKLNHHSFSSIPLCCTK
jgi:hypothetical protein